LGDEDVDRQMLALLNLTPQAKCFFVTLYSLLLCCENWSDTKGYFNYENEETETQQSNSLVWDYSVSDWLMQD
jgi:hypothetical protein